MRPGGQLSDIKMRYAGAKSARIIEGKLVLELAHGSLTESIPASWLQENNEKQDIAYQVLSNGDKGILIQLLNKTENKGLNQTLIVDPVPTLDWATYYGGSDFEWSPRSTIDNQGNVYITGYTYSQSLIHTLGAFKDTLGGYIDAFIAKFGTTGNISWSTYFGGSGFDIGSDGFVDEDGNYYLAGETESDTLFATPGAHQFAPGGGIGRDGFIAKFDFAGNLIWNTYYGGNGSDEMNGIHGDNNGSIYIVGFTRSNNNISTTGAHDTTISDSELGCAYLAKFNTDGVRQWGTYFDGDDQDIGLDCYTDHENNVIISFITQSTTGIATVGAHQTTHEGGYDAGIAKFNSSGVLQWSTYYGGQSYEYGEKIAVDRDNNIIMAGWTLSSNEIATPGSYQPILLGFHNIFLVKFDKEGTRLWGTYIGTYQLSHNIPKGLDVDLVGNIYISGTNDDSSSQYHTSNGYKTNTDGVDASIMKFDPNGQRRWGSYVGGIGYDKGRSVNVDYLGNIVLVGESEDTAVAARFSTPGTYQTQNNGNDIFIARYTQDDLVTFVSDTAGCDSIKIFETTYTKNGRATLAISNPVCCDTLYVVNIALGRSTNEAVTASACGSYELNGEFYTQTGTYTQVIPNASGCDSTITFNLSITPAGVDADFVVASQLITKHEVSIVNITQQTPDSMQWVLPTSSSYTVKSKTDDELILEFADSGTYEFGLRTFLGTCSNYSSKQVRVLESQGFGPVAGQGPLINKFTVFPNPSSNQFTAEIVLSKESDIRLRILDPITNQVLDDKLKTGAAEYTAPYSLALQRGVYIMLLETANGNLIARFVIQ